MTALSKALALLVATIPTHVASVCVNDPDFVYFFENKERSCKNIRINEIRRQTLCPEETVNVACPQTCGSCCEDQADFTFTRKNGQDGDCEWLAAKQERIDRYCNEIELGFPSSSGGTVRDGCPVTCDFCFSEIAQATISPAPTVTASGAPSGSPSSAPSGGPSAVPTGMPSPTPTEEPTRPPSPMPSPFPTLRPTSAPSDAPSQLPSKSPSDTPSQLPSQSPSDVPSKSPSSQPSAQPSKMPSDVPSKSPSSQPSAQPSKMPSNVPSQLPSNSPSDVPSTSPSDVPSDLPSKAPSDQPSNNPTMSIKPSPLPSAAPEAVVTDAPTDAPVVAPACVNDSSFTFTLVNMGTEQPCGWITKNGATVDDRIKNYCDTDPAIKAACPQACGTCVGDDPLFEFKLKNVGKLVGCDWITTNDSKTAIRLAYCDRANVKAGCAETCA